VFRISLHGDSGSVSSDDESGYRYFMNHSERGRLIIINNKEFLPRTGMNKRKGTDEDATSLFTDFKKLGFDVQVKSNQTAEQMLQLMIEGNVC